ncbi:F1 [Hirschfeldia incana]|nr:F1 [Hirschfeldia incana]
MSCKGDVVLRLEEVLLLLPSNLFNEIFLDCIGPFPQSYRGGIYKDRKPIIWYASSNGSMKKQSDDAGSRGIKPRGTGVFLPARPVSIPEEKSQKKKTCPITSSRSKQVFLPKEWAY